MQVMTDQSAVATAEGNSPWRCQPPLNELLMKNALTKVDDPAIDEMPVIPSTCIAEPDPNGRQIHRRTHREAERERPEVALYPDASRWQKTGSEKTSTAKLLPTLNMYGYYAAQAPLPQETCLATEPAAVLYTLPTGLSQHVPEHFQLFVPRIPGRHDAFHQPAQPPGQGRSVACRADVPAKARSNPSSIRKAFASTWRTRSLLLNRLRPAVDAAQKARGSGTKTFDITKQEQQLGAKSSVDTLNAENVLAQAESALDTAQSAYEKPRWI